MGAASCPGRMLRSAKLVAIGWPWSSWLVSKLLARREGGLLSRENAEKAGLSADTGEVVRGAPPADGSAAEGPAVWGRRACTGAAAAPW